MRVIEGASFDALASVPLSQKKRDPTYLIHVQFDL